MPLPNYYSDYNQYIRRSQAGPVVTEPARIIPKGVAPRMSLGQLEENPPKEFNLGYFVASSLGASIAGGLIGYLSSGGKKSGAYIGAALLGGVTGLSDMALFLKEDNKQIALLAGLLSVAALGGAFYGFTELK